MSHDVIIKGKPPGGTLLAAGAIPASAEIRWTPPHDMAPAKERRRIERAEEKLNQALEILSGPDES